MPFNLCYSPKMFCVYDNDKPASKIGYPELSYPGTVGWDTHKFDSFPKALAYACHWVGHLIQPEDFFKHRDTTEETRYSLDYSGHGDVLEIRCENA